MRGIVLISVLSVIASGCAEGPVGPSTYAPSTHGNLEINSMGVSQAGQGAPGKWQYKIAAHLRETGGVDVTVTNIQVRAFVLAQNTLATASVIPMLSVSANSSSDAGFVFLADTHVEDLSALTVVLTLQFSDANGNAGAVFKSLGPCAGCWDY